MKTINKTTKHKKCRAQIKRLENRIKCLERILKFIAQRPVHSWAMFIERNTGIK